MIIKKLNVVSLRVFFLSWLKTTLVNVNFIKHTKTLLKAMISYKINFQDYLIKTDKTLKLR